MVQKVSNLNTEGLRPDSDTEPDEKEISDDDDDDRNHKHRRRDTQSQSADIDPVEQVQIRPYRKRNKPFENSHPSMGRDSQSSESWKKGPALAAVARVPSRANKSVSMELGLGRGSGVIPGSWIHHDPRFSSVDVTSQMVPRGSVPPNLFAGRGLPGMSNTQGSPWSAYGLIPGIRNGCMDSLHPLGLQGAIRPSVSPPQNMGIMRQRCRDFEERGFCLRGDMCPMEHGVNRIVIEDVQSLSQFNFPVSLPSGQFVGSSATLPSVCTSSSAMMNSSSLHRRSGMPGMGDGSWSNGVSTVSVCADGSDFYDPDQPLWTNDRPEASTDFRVDPAKFDVTECVDSGNLNHAKSNATEVGPQGTTSSVWGRICTNSKSEMKGRFDSTLSSLHSNANKAKEFHIATDSFKDASHEETIGLQDVNTSLKTQDVGCRGVRKPTQKALRTLFVNGIPKKDNKIEALLSHFKKFGNIIDIYIPQTGDRAFIQFSRREEAENALKAPDAVMGNRFIKLLWANRDRIPENVSISGGSASATPRAEAALAPSHQYVADKGKVDLQLAASKTSCSNTDVSPVPDTNKSKPVVASVTKLPPPSQKKPGNLALLEEFRKMQESFFQKRNALQQELAQMEKKATCPKGEVASVQVAKRQKVGTAVDNAKAEAPNSSDSGTKMASTEAEVTDQKKPAEDTMQRSSSGTLATFAKHEPSSLRQSIHLLAPPGALFAVNRFKLDNRPTAFKISPPLPSGFENVEVLKEHFSAYGELSSVELEGGQSCNSVSPQNCLAVIRFANRPSAEKAFTSGKCWQDHTLQFTWLPPTNSCNGSGNKERAPNASEVSTAISAESGNSGSKNGNGECAGKGEDLGSSSSSLSGDS